MDYFFGLLGLAVLIFAVAKLIKEVRKTIF
ncbi:hypothetical protein SAMN06296241_1377 [Salinimicrobium sediminis]|uniref:Uncharacterized protein n=1 Tax=Salinimicrobium sediminis TaxID=1343891 RepID=A0A285X602_9FLAO|nr:hypothetical protein SAMN06296241_1377 [Salinimicrobium sediminis]